MSGTEKWNRVLEPFGRVSGTRFLCPALDETLEYRLQCLVNKWVYEGSVKHATYTETKMALTISKRTGMVTSMYR